MLYLVGAVLCPLFNVTPAIALGAGLLLAILEGYRPPNRFAGGPRLQARSPNRFASLRWGGPWAGVLAGTSSLELRRMLSKSILQASVVLLGFGMDMHVVLKAGQDGLLFALATISGSFIVGALLARLLDVRSQVSTLISTGTAICGGSAIAAVGGAIGAAENDMTVALGTIFILNGVALYLFPWLGHLLGLTQSQFGVWAGVAIHDVSSVVGATGMYGAQAESVGTAVKLARALWIFPVALIAARLARREKAVPVAFPWFIVAFLAASVLYTLLPPVAHVGPYLYNAGKRGMALTLFLIGSLLSVSALKDVGWRPLVQGVLLWLFLGTTALVAVQQM